MRKHLWKVAAVAAVLVMTVSALTALAAEKKSRPVPAGKACEQTMPGCGMKGEMAKEMPGCGTKRGMAKEMSCCAMKGGMAKEMSCCAMKGGMGKGMAGCAMKGGMGKGMAGCDMMGGMGKGMAGCDMMGGMGKGMPGCGPMGGPGMGMGHGPMMLQGLDLTAEQQKKLAGIHERQARLAIQAQADLRIATMDLQKLAHADSPDKGAIDAQIDKVAQLRARMMKSHTATLLEVRAMLTPEQLKKWRAAPMGGGEDFD